MNKKYDSFMPQPIPVQDFMWLLMPTKKYGKVFVGFNILHEIDHEVLGTIRVLMQQERIVIATRSDNHREWHIAKPIDLFDLIFDTVVNEADIQIG